MKSRSNTALAALIHFLWWQQGSLTGSQTLDCSNSGSNCEYKDYRSAHRWLIVEGVFWHLVALQCLVYARLYLAIKLCKKKSRKKKKTHCASICVIIWLQVSAQRFVNDETEITVKSSYSKKHRHILHIHKVLKIILSLTYFSVTEILSVLSSGRYASKNLFCLFGSPHFGMFYLRVSITVKRIKRDLWCILFFFLFLQCFKFTGPCVKSLES